MNFRTTLLLLVLVAAVGVTLFFTRNHNDTKPKETAEHKLIDIDSGDVTGVTITNADDKRLVLKKSGIDWKLAEPVAASAKGFEVDDLVRNLVGIQSRGQMDEAKITSGGLDHPSFFVELATKSGKITKLKFGDKSTFGDSSYVLLNDNTKPDVVGSSIYTQLDKPVSNYREMKLVNTSTDQVKQLAITQKGKTIKLEKRGDAWQMTEPVQAPAETSAVSDLVMGITGLNATEFVDSPASLSKYELNRPKITVWFSMQVPTTQPATTQPTAAGQMTGGDVLRLGGYQDITKKNMFASLNVKEVVIVPATVEKAFEKTALDLRNKELINIDSDQVSGFTLAINRPATTQPTTQPADIREFAIDRRQEAAPTLGLTLPASHVIPTTQPTTGAATQPTTQPVMAPTQPAVPASKWLFSSGKQGDAEEGQVKALLDSFHPLRVEKYIENSATTQPVSTITLTLRTIASKAGETGEQYVLHFSDHPTDSKLIGTYKDLSFEVDHGLLDKLLGDFKTKKPVVAPTPPPSFPGAGGGSPFGG